MQNFVRQLITEWRKLKLPFVDKTCVVAVSGGADSVGLLLALHELKKLGKLNLRFVAAHFNHNLRGVESDADESFVKSLAERFDFELALGNGEILGETGNLEQNARDARYRFLCETAENLDAFGVLTAHTLNDQAETFLSNLIRGSGIEGLSGMPVVRNLESQISNLESQENSESDEKSAICNPQSAIKLVRPLLNWAKRVDTENFCRLNEVEFRFDSMNEDLKFNRVRIRKVLLPLLKDFNPKVVETLARTANLLRENIEQFTQSSRQLRANQSNNADAEVESSHSEPEAAKQKTKAANKIEELVLRDLKDVFPSVRRLILREWLKENRGTLRRLELKHIQAIESLIASRKSGRTIELPDGERIIKKDGKLLFQKT